eukprot:506806-Lingulodinium_polyedra.AAC.1
MSLPGTPGNVPAGAGGQNSRQAARACFCQCSRGPPGTEARICPCLPVVARVWVLRVFISAFA